MKLGFKKWFSILGLLLAIIISLGIGTYFDLSILEGMTPGEGEEMPEEVKEEGEETPVEDDAPVEETPVEDEREEDVDMTLADMSDPESPTRKKSGQEVFKNIMNNGTTESFSLIQNF